MIIIKRNCLLIISLLLVLIIIHAYLPASNEYWLMVRILIGIFGLIFLPGFTLLINIINLENVNVGASLILGFMLQLLNVYFIGFFSTFHGPVNFTYLIYILSFAEMSSVAIASYKYKLMAKNLNRLNKELNIDKILVIIIILYLILALYWQCWAPAPHSDGAAYLDMARNVVEKGLFRSNMLFPENTWSYVEYSSGMHVHIFGYFAIALFFMLGNVSLFSAKIMLIFAGLLVILVSYELSRILFNKNVARISALITAISPELLTHVGLVGGPEIPSALFILFSIYILIYTTISKRTINIVLVAGLSLFIAWYAWYFNFFVMLTFIPLLFIYISGLQKEFKFIDLIFLLFLIASFIVEYRILLPLTFAVIGVYIPSLNIINFIIIYLFIFKKIQYKNTLFMFTILFLILYLLYYTRVIAISLTPEYKHFITTKYYSRIEVLTDNVARDVSLFSRAFIPEEVSKYWNMYWNGVYDYLGKIVVFLSFLSLIRVNRFKETLLIISFPLLQAIWWALFSPVDDFQPRYIVCSSLFYYILTASLIDMFYLYLCIIYHPINTIYLKIKIKIEDHLYKIFNIHAKSFANFFITLFMLSLLIVCIYPTYNKQRTIMESWNFPQHLHWKDAISWIKENTSSEDVIAARYGNYFAWYTNRKVVGLFPSIYSSTMNLTDLVSLIKMYRIKYLVIDISFYWHYKNLRQLYTNPRPFLGSKIVFQSESDAFRVIIYNVTNIIICPGD